VTEEFKHVDKAVPVKERVKLKQFYGKVKDEMLFQPVGCIGHNKIYPKDGLMHGILSKVNLIPLDPHAYGRFMLPDWYAWRKRWIKC